MPTSQRKAGRPSEPTDARALLIHHARELFVVKPYGQVSTRLVASKAGVNSALISYYFGSKAGLFEAVVRDTLAPLVAKVHSLVSLKREQQFLDIMKTYYQEMSKTPLFPRLIFQTMYSSPTDTQRRLMEKIFAEMSGMIDRLFDELQSSGVIQPEADAQLARITYVSMMVFPFIAPPSLFEVHKISLTPEFLDRLFKHNIAVMKSGLLNPSIMENSYD